MKKFALFITALALFALTSCNINQEDIPQPQQTNPTEELEDYRDHIKVKEIDDRAIQKLISADVDEEIIARGTVFGH